jgi:hypothetical protein
MSTEFKLRDGEVDVFSAFANKVGFIISSGGKLVLTSQRLLFCNRRKTKILSEHDLNDILYIGAGRNVNLFAFLLIIPLLINSAVKILLKNGKSLRFVVSDKSQWISMLNEYRTKKP